MFKTSKVYRRYTPLTLLRVSFLQCYMETTFINQSLAYSYQSTVGQEEVLSLFFFFLRASQMLTAAIFRVYLDRH